MDIIEIDSSDSEDEFGTGSLSSEEFCVDDRVDQLDSNSQWRVENNDPQAVFPTRSSNYNDYRAAAPGFTLDAASSTTISGASLGNSATKTVMHGPRLGAYETIVDFERAKFKNNLSPSRMSKGSELSSLTNPESEAISARSGMGLNSSTLLNQGTPFSIQKDVTKPGRDHREDLYKDAPKRVLPPSMFSSKNKTLAKDFSSLKDEKKNGVYMSSSFAGENAFHDLTRIKAPQFADEKLSTLPRASLESRDDLHRNATTSRMLPSSFVLGKVIHTLPSPSTSDGERHLGIGGDRHLERDERHIYQEALQNLGQPRLEDDLPEGLLAVPLLKHQKIALAWMAQKEKSVHCSGGILADDQGLGKTISMIALIQKQMPQQSKFTSDDSNCAKPEALNLDEDEDVVVEVDKTKPLSVDNDQIRRRVAGSVMHTSNNSRPAAGTLVVCPATVLRQWARELDEKVPDNARLSVLVYHGGTRTKDPNELAKYHVVLTTYSIITNEVPKQPIADDDEGEQKNLDKYGLIPEFGSNKKRKQASSGQNNMKKKRKNLKGFIDFSSGPLARVRWFRVILDEAQTIKNHRTQVARACCGLRAKRRWCLSGTPMQNAIDDLYSYFRFLKYDPYSLYSSFCASIKYPISKNASNGYKKLQAVLKTVLLRRTKDSFIDGEPILKLPPKSICLKKVDFSQEERDFYLKLEADSRQQFKEFAATGTLRQNYASILMLLLRLRQACDHPLLVKGFHTDTIGKFSVDMARQLPRDMQVNLLNQLEGSLPICAVCSDPPEDAVVSMCGHVFCYQCVSECLTGDDNTCPAPRCKDVLGNDSVFSRSTLRSCISDNFDDEASTSTAFEEHHITHSGYISSKIKAALDILKPIACSSSRTVNNLMICGPDSNEDSTNHVSTYLSSNSKVPDKAIVFSQWTSMLDLLELSLNDSLIQYRRLDGRMSLMSRDQAVKDFNTDPEVTVMLMSLKAGSLGLNMVAACHVILLDLWWNPTTEDQAVDRAHRIGQTRPVTVSRITIKDTVEDRILALQEEKRKMVASAFGEDQAGTHATKLTIDDLRYLFNCFND